MMEMKGKNKMKRKKENSGREHMREVTLLSQTRLAVHQTEKDGDENLVMWKRVDIRETRLFLYIQLPFFVCLLSSTPRGESIRLLLAVIANKHSRRQSECAGKEATNNNN